ncbi:hypothetical protein [Celeribacter indicus]|uniref:hypothetical protein n=1 Tax=Celeribacter indicus TaxID=1208324 RepID=UPI000896BA67|nr:hypothetical protein [Celeribacter indicus]SDW55214.1 hypothetical protein SAMN05443573_104222 [Celeribacter indicus]
MVRVRGTNQNRHLFPNCWKNWEWSQMIASEPEVQKALDASHEALLPEMEP